MAPRSSRSLLASLALLLALASLARGCSDDSTEAAAGASGASVAGAAGSLAGRGGSAGKAGKAGSAGKAGGGSAGSSAGTGDAGSAGADAGAAGSDAGSAGSAGSHPGPTGCGPYTPPPTVPAGWVEYTDWSCLCRLYRPPTPDLMPAPIAWQACPPQVDPSLSCQRMATPWSQPGQSPLAFFPKVWPVPGSSQVLLQFSRLHHDGNPDVRYHLIAEADGPVRQAFLQVNPVSGGCFMNAQGLSEGKYLWTMKGDTWDEPGTGKVEGFLAGDLDSLPSAIAKQPKEPGLASNWDVSASWIVQNKGIRYVRPWDKPTESTLIHAGAQDPDGALATLTALVGPRVLLGVGQAQYHGISIWSPDQGLQPWQRWSGDLTRGAGNVGTDGKDVVWTYGEGKKPQDEEFPATSVFTAPFATDMATIETTKRRLRADVSRPADRFSQYSVGCGYAARRYDVGGTTSNLLIVRLSDGRGWKILGQPMGPAGVAWVQVLGVSCEHVYVGLETKESSSSIVRIPLASLGPGLAPD